MRIIRTIPVIVLALASVVAEAQQRPPVRPLGAVSAKSAETFRSIVGIRALSNGSVLVNDVMGRRVVLFDPQLSTATLVADSTSATANAYGGRTGSLVAYRGDSSIFVDPASVSMLIIDAWGKVARVMAIPRAEDAMMIGSASGNTSFDAAGRLIYRSGAGGMRMMGGPTRVTRDNTGAARAPQMSPPEIPDSAFILAVNLATRRLDTLGYIRTPKVRFEVQHDAEGGMRMQSMVNPLPVVDDWAVLPDGTVAFVRGRDFHIDWVGLDGTRTSSAKIPFDWQRLTDEDKAAFLDSLKAARARLGANAPTIAGAPQDGGAAAPQVMVFSHTITGGGGGPGPRANAAAPRPTEIVYVPAAEIPDYKPAFFAGSTRADSEGNLWIRTIPTTAQPGGPVYDVVDRKGQVVERVQVPAGRTIIGFGPQGAVYLLNAEGGSVTLERASVR